MQNGTPSVPTLAGVSEHSETDAGNVPEKRMFHVRGVVFVPVFYERDVYATDVEAACAEFADSLAKSRDGGIPRWSKRSPAYVHDLGDGSERSEGTRTFVPKRYRVPQFET